MVHPAKRVTMGCWIEVFVTYLAVFSIDRPECRKTLELFTHSVAISNLSPVMTATVQVSVQRVLQVRQEWMSKWLWICFSEEQSIHGVWGVWICCSCCWLEQSRECHLALVDSNCHWELTGEWMVVEVEEVEKVEAFAKVTEWDNCKDNWNVLNWENYLRLFKVNG